jgi:hypothetical protein
MQPQDETTADAYAAQTEAYRRMGGRERTAVMFRLNELARQTAAAAIRGRHPDYDDEQVRRALLRLWLGDALAAAVWPDRPLVDP